VAAVIDDTQLGRTVVAALEGLKAIEKRCLRLCRWYLILLGLEVELVFENFL